MHALVVEDDPISGKLMQNILLNYGSCDLAVDGLAALQAFRRSMDDKKPYDLICMDIMMPGMSGQEALKRIRRIENQSGIPQAHGVKVMMTTALSQTEEVAEAFFEGGACAYFVKPIDANVFIDELKRVGMIPG